MMTIEQYDFTQPSMRKAWKAEFHEFLVESYKPSLVSADKVFQAINNVDNFIKKNNLGEKILRVKDIGVAEKLKRTMLEYRSYGMGATVSANDFKVIALEKYIAFLKSKSDATPSFVQSDDQQIDKEQTANATPSVVRSDDQQIDKEQTATEGIIKEVKYFRNQRNRTIRDQCAKRDNYTCQVCGFNFEKVYGERGKEFIEVHHKNPMANFDGKHEIELKDLISLCSNCHSMIHYGGEFLDVDKLRSLMSR